MVPVPARFRNIFVHIYSFSYSRLSRFPSRSPSCFRWKNIGRDTVKRFSARFRPFSSLAKTPCFLLAPPPRPYQSRVVVSGGKHHHPCARAVATVLHWRSSLHCDDNRLHLHRRGSPSSSIHSVQSLSVSHPLSRLPSRTTRFTTGKGVYPTDLHLVDPQDLTRQLTTCLKAPFHPPPFQMDVEI
jgi:hypothetical protein